MTRISTQTPPGNIQHLADCSGCDRCDVLMDLYLACDGCGEWGHKDSAHRYEMRDGDVICESCQAASMRMMEPEPEADAKSQNEHAVVFAPGIRLR